ncbi:MAG: BatD family protein [Gemmatimonadales bacterium]|nr:BatD family protein [Gemmatimonadales bacterium]
MSARVAAGVAIALAVAGASATAQDGVTFRATIAPDTVYVGQQANYTLTVRIPADVRQRLRRNPEFVPPEARAMLAYDLPPTKVDPTADGPEEHVFRRALFPLTPGRYNIPASRLTYALPQSPSFFSREEERTLRSEPLAFVAIDPPLRGRPAGWSGAVGRWSAAVRVDGTAARVGDPFVLTLRVSGTGNATLLPRPVLSVAWADIVPEDERVVLDSTPTTLGGAKEFSWLVTPREAGPRVVPVIDYVYFDPGSRGYEVARSSPVSLRIAAGDLVQVPSALPASPADTVLPIRPGLAGPRPIALPLPWLWMWGALLAPLPWAFIAWRSRRPRVRRVRTPLERLSDAPTADASTVRALFEEELRGRTGVRLERATSQGALVAALRREGVTAEAAAAAEQLRDSLDAAAYAGRSARPDLRERSLALLKRIGSEARRGAPALLLAGALALSGAPEVLAQSGEPALLAFTEGHTAYVGRDFVRARDAFLRAARAAPRDPAAWTNFGTAAWQAADTASAVLGWQRALRLDPLARDLRPLLQRVRAPQSRGAAQVWAVPILPVAALAFLLWCGAWGLLAWQARRGTLRARAFLLVVPGLACALLAYGLETRLRAQSLVVIAGAEPLRNLPALGADPGAMPLVGEIARVRERRGVWLRLELEAGRSGWYPAERAYALARD